MSREWADWVGTAERRHMESLLDAVATPRRYREIMQELGHDLGKRLARLLPKKVGALVVCTVEDADFLARGILSEISHGRTTRVACFWNERDTIDNHEVAPIVARYEEPFERADIGAVVVVKSIISGACVVRTNLNEVLEKVAASVPIFVAAPAMHVDAAAKLEHDFTPRVTARFKYLYCAKDTERLSDGTVVPGIGGSVYELLGLGDEDAKNRHRPSLLTARMAQMKA